MSKILKIGSGIALGALISGVAMAVPAEVSTSATIITKSEQKLIKVLQMGQ
jgi:hypothetical protein